MISVKADLSAPSSRRPSPPYCLLSQLILSGASRADLTPLLLLWKGFASSQFRRAAVALRQGAVGAKQGHCPIRAKQGRAPVSTLDRDLLHREFHYATLPYLLKNTKLPAVLILRLSAATAACLKTLFLSTLQFQELPPESNSPKYRLETNYEDPL